MTVPAVLRSELAPRLRAFDEAVAVVLDSDEVTLSGRELEDLVIAGWSLGVADGIDIAMGARPDLLDLLELVQRQA